MTDKLWYQHDIELPLHEALSKVQQQTQYYSVQNNDMIGFRQILYWLNQGDN